MTDEGVAYIAVGISMFFALAIPFTIILIVEHKSTTEVGMKQRKEERFVIKTLKKTCIFWHTQKKTYLTIEPQDSNLIHHLNISAYTFVANTDKPDLTRLDKWHDSVYSVYEYIKCGEWIPIYKGLQNYEEFLSNQKRYLKSIPEYFWFKNTIFKASNIDKLRYIGNYNVEYLISIDAIEGEDVLDGHTIRFVNPYSSLVKEQDGDQPIERVEWVWNENDVNIYILQNIYKNTKPMSEWKFDLKNAAVDQAKELQRN